MAELMLRAPWRTPDQSRAHFLNAVAPWCKEQWAAGRELQIEIRLLEDVKSDRQRVYFHDYVLAEIARQARPGGVAYSKATWKAHFHAEYVGTRTVSVLDPTTGKTRQVQQRVSTEELDMAEYADLIDRVSAYAIAELGVVFPVSWPQYERDPRDPDTGEAV